MILTCPSCKKTIDISNLHRSTFLCPGCGEEIDVGQFREATCPICCCEFGADDKLVMCPDCKVLYHSECWEENHGCATYGCTSTKHEETHTSAASGPSTSQPFGGSRTGNQNRCPFCGEMHEAGGLVCPSCGRVLRENVNTASDNFAAIQSWLADCAVKLGRNFQLLLSDAKQFLALGLKPFSQYADFHGKTGRSEYLSFVFVFFLMSWLLAALADFLLLLGWCAYLVPILATTARRLRDTGLSPWMMLAVPLVPLLVLVPTVKES